ncbi:hypothetical protein CA14_006298 [Aspergillus flavus]|uniref:Xaa-Pro dipeptidyl-peptidase-like domain-containing protein n=1 Tax=Aspergillus flavus TaxID=5059 RepID=A0AB74BV40_ASPFL|nr:hypothetical protein CA14_006298 [Aspergillus flavus]
MAHGFSALKEMDLDAFAAHFVSKLPLSCLVYDNRGFGDIDTKDQPRHEILPAQQISDYSDAITYAQSRSDVDSHKIGVWGSSYSGGHVLWLGAVDKRVKAVLSQGGSESAISRYRLARAAGKPPGMLPVVNADVHGPSALPTPNSYDFFMNWAKKKAFLRALEPKQLHILPGGHFDGYSGPNFEANAGCQTEFLRKHLCSSEMAGYAVY